VTIALPPASRQRSSDRAMETLSWGRLPGTAREADAISALPLFARSSVLRREEASEAALRGLSGPRILHVATHGFFLPNRVTEAPSEDREDAAARTEAAAESPLVRSGLVLAGANRRSAAVDGDDGVLTALEVTDLDLHGTELAVMSACETAVGETRRGEGVFGLQRALALAGVRTRVMSLWRVDDDATAVVMAAYYARLARGEGRGEAMRQVRLGLIAGADDTAALTSTPTGSPPSAPAMGSAVASDLWRHPYYWASFLVSGDVSPLETRAPSGRAERGRRGGR
jgi:CHAT domain-containing protein